MFQYLIVLLVTTGSVNADGKRLLLTDPDILAQRLSQLESTVQQLQLRLSAKESRLKVFFLLVNYNVRSIELNFVVSFSSNFVF